MKRNKGFTVIEMMVAMAVLSMIVIAMARIYQQSITATNTGYNMSRGVLVGRTILQFVISDLNDCYSCTAVNTFEKFDITDPTTKYQTVTYTFDGATLSRDSQELYSTGTQFNTVSIESFIIEPGPVDAQTGASYVDVSLIVKIEAFVGAPADFKEFASRVYLNNGMRYEYGKYAY